MSDFKFPPIGLGIALLLSAALVFLIVLTSDLPIHPMVLLILFGIITGALVVSWAAGQVWGVLHMKVSWYHDKYYGLWSGTRYKTLSVTLGNDGCSYGTVEAMDGRTKGVVRVVNFGAGNKPPPEFIYHHDRTIVGLAAKPA